jgi:restriction system protein
MIGVVLAIGAVAAATSAAYEFVVAHREQVLPIAVAAALAILVVWLLLVARRPHIVNPDDPRFVSLRRRGVSKRQLEIGDAVYRACTPDALRVLNRRYKMGVRVDDYGVADYSAANRELEDFGSRFVVPLLVRGPKKRDADFIVGLLGQERLRQENEDAALYAQGAPIADVRNGFDYEALVADRLNRCGWSAMVTRATGDHGADVVASRGAVVVVAQCKFYNSAVGNKAVQEAYSARPLYGAHHAIVVAPRGFTNHAKTAAANLDVMLLHHDELDTLAARLGV